MSLIYPKQEDNKLIVRKACRRDATDLAHFVNMAGSGLAYYLWTQSAADDENPWDIGRRRACRSEGSFAWPNAMIAEIGEAIAGGIVSYDLADEPEAIDSDVPEQIAALIELENQVLSSHYINVLSVYPEHQGQGCARALLRAVGEGAKGKSQSIIVDQSNGRALGLYQSEGFEIRDRRSIGPTPWNKAADDWLLLVK